MIRDYFLDAWYEFPFVNIRGKLLGITPSNSNDKVKKLAFDFAYYRVRKLQHQFKGLYKDPLALDAANLSYIIDKHAEAVCIRMLALADVDFGAQFLQKHISTHEKLIRQIECGSKNPEDHIQIQISIAMIKWAKHTIKDYGIQKM